MGAALLARGARSGESSNEWFRQRLAQRKAEDAAELAREKTEAHARGKEPFDLDRFEALFDTTDGTGCQASRETRLKTWEWRYYLVHRDVMTIEEFARLREELEGWR